MPHFSIVNAYPSEQSAVNKANMNEKLKRSFLKLVGYFEDSTLIKLPEVRAKINSEAAFGYNAYCSHDNLLTALKSRDFDGAYDEICALSEKTLSFEQLSISTIDEDSDADLLSILSREYNGTYELNFDAKALTVAEENQTRSVVLEVIDKIREHDIKTYQEIQALIDRFLLIDSGSINAGTTFQCFGCIYLTKLKENQDWTAYLEHIVHETAHHYLFSVQVEHELILNEASGRYKSPLRRELRPLSGIYHAMFVLARTIRMKNIFSKTEQYLAKVSSMSTQYNNSKNGDSFEKKFLDAVGVIRSDARLSPVGEDIMEQCVEMVGA